MPRNKKDKDAAPIEPIEVRYDGDSKDSTRTVSAEDFFANKIKVDISDDPEIQVIQTFSYPSMDGSYEAAWNRYQSEKKHGNRRAQPPMMPLTDDGKVIVEIAYEYVDGNSNTENEVDRLRVKVDPAVLVAFREHGSETITNIIDKQTKAGVNAGEVLDAIAIATEIGMNAGNENRPLNGQEAGDIISAVGDVLNDIRIGKKTRDRSVNVGRKEYDRDIKLPTADDFSNTAEIGIIEARNGEWKRVGADTQLFGSRTVFEKDSRHEQVASAAAQNYAEDVVPSIKTIEANLDKHYAAYIKHQGNDTNVAKVKALFQKEVEEELSNYFVYDDANARITRLPSVDKAKLKEAPATTFKAGKQDKFLDTFAPVYVPAHLTKDVARIHEKYQQYAQIINGVDEYGIPLDDVGLTAAIAAVKEEQEQVAVADAGKAIGTALEAKSDLAKSLTDHEANFASLKNKRGEIGQLPEFSKADLTPDYTGLSAEQQADLRTYEAAKANQQVALKAIKAFVFKGSADGSITAFEKDAGVKFADVDTKKEFQAVAKAIEKLIKKKEITDTGIIGTAELLEGANKDRYGFKKKERAELEAASTKYSTNNADVKANIEKIQDVGFSGADEYLEYAQSVQAVNAKYDVYENAIESAQEASNNASGSANLDAKKTELDGIGLDQVKEAPLPKDLLDKIGKSPSISAIDYNAKMYETLAAAAAIPTDAELNAVNTIDVSSVAGVSAAGKGNALDGNYFDYSAKAPAPAHNMTAAEQDVLHEDLTHVVGNDRELFTKIAGADNRITTDEIIAAMKNDSDFATAMQEKGVNIDNISGPAATGLADVANQDQGRGA